jgi:hypothetical protein
MASFSGKTARRWILSLTFFLCRDIQNLANLYTHSRGWQSEFTNKYLCLGHPGVCVCVCVCGVNQMKWSIFALSHWLQWHYCGRVTLCEIIAGVFVALKLRRHVDIRVLSISQWNPLTGFALKFSYLILVWNFIQLCDVCLFREGLFYGELWKVT